MFVDLLRSESPFNGGIFVDPRASARAPPPWPRAPATAIVRPAAPRRPDGFLHYRPSFFFPFHARPLVFRRASRFSPPRSDALCSAGVLPLDRQHRTRSLRSGPGLAKRARKVVLDLSDDWTTFHDLDPARRGQRLQTALAMADAVTAVNPHVLAQVSPPPRTRLRQRDRLPRTSSATTPQYRLGDVLPRRPGQRIVGFVGGLHVGRVDEACCTVDRTRRRTPPSFSSVT